MLGSNPVCLQRGPYEASEGIYPGEDKENHFPLVWLLPF